MSTLIEIILAIAGVVLAIMFIISEFKHQQIKDTLDEIKEILMKPIEMGGKEQ